MSAKVQNYLLKHSEHTLILHFNIKYITLLKEHFEMFLIPFQTHETFRGKIKK